MGKSSEPSKYSSYKGTSANAYKEGKPGRTEEGYTDKMVKNILGAEQSIRKNEDESAYVFDPKGKLVGVTGGKGAEVSLEGIKMPKDAIVTHNHPRSLGKKGISAIGNSFSLSDIKTAVANDVKEIRAVTPTYTFSLKRPKKGWGSYSKIVKRYNEINNALTNAGNKSLRYVSYSMWDTRVERLNTTHFHKLMKQLSSEFGWNYTKKRG